MITTYTSFFKSESVDSDQNKDVLEVFVNIKLV